MTKLPPHADDPRAAAPERVVAEGVGTEGIGTEAAARHLAEAVTEAGALALSMFRAGVKSWTKGQNSPVTEADIAVDRFLKERLSALSPDFGWLSEETADNDARLSRRRVWVVDPIDGTRGFMEGLADWAVSAALVEDGRPIAAALFAPALNELFVAAAGRGATRNGLALSAGRLGAIAGARIAGPPSGVDLFARVAEVERLPRTRSLALRIARVATGEIDIALAARNSHDWDLAAADLLVQEAAGSLIDYTGNSIRYNSPHPRHAELVCAGPYLIGPALAVARAGAGAIANPSPRPETP